eukprot:SAG22_NODE_13782_length_395_cov_0.695946_1_plen_100_part_00
MYWMHHQGFFFFFFVYPFLLRQLDNLTKFELTPEMQAELKELVEKKKRGEFKTESKMLNTMMEDLEKRDTKVDKLEKIKRHVADKKKARDGGGGGDDGV